MRVPVDNHRPAITVMVSQVVDMLAHRADCVPLKAVRTVRSGG